MDRIIIAGIELRNSAIVLLKVFIYDVSIQKELMLKKEDEYEQHTHDSGRGDADRA